MAKGEVVRLIALSSVTSKKTGKVWYRAILRSYTPDGSPVCKEFWLSQNVGDECKRLGIVEDVDVIVEAGLDEFLRFEITRITPALEGVVEI